MVRRIISGEHKLKKNMAGQDINKSKDLKEILRTILCDQQIN